MRLRTWVARSRSVSRHDGDAKPFGKLLHAAARWESVNSRPDIDALLRNASQYCFGLERRGSLWHMNSCETCWSPPLLIHHHRLVADDPQELRLVGVEQTYFLQAARPHHRAVLLVDVVGLRKDLALVDLGFRPNGARRHERRLDALGLGRATGHCGQARRRGAGADELSSRAAYRTSSPCAACPTGSCVVNVRRTPIRCKRGA